MSLASIIIPPEYGYVLAVASSTTLLHAFHFRLTAARRYAAKVPYPIAYAPADEAEKDENKAAFNAAQKAQAQFTENYPPFLVALLTAGLHYPVPAAWLGGAWILSRFVYGWGYARVGKQYSGGRGRMIGAWNPLPLILLMGMGMYGTIKAVL